MVMARIMATIRMIKDTTISKDTEATMVIMTIMDTTKAKTSTKMDIMMPAIKATKTSITMINIMIKDNNPSKVTEDTVRAAVEEVDAATNPKRIQRHSATSP